jgi:hypothetical protein
MEKERFTPALLYALGGFIVWGARFLGVYSFTALACARGWASAEFFGIDVVRGTIVLATIISVALCLALIYVGLTRLRRGHGGESRRFLHLLAILTAGLAVLAIFWETVPVLLVRLCEPNL